MSSAYPLQEGARVANLVVARGDVALLHLTTRARTYLLKVAILIALFTGILTVVSPAHRIPTGTDRVWWERVFMICLMLVVLINWRSFTFDGTSRKVVSRHGPFSRCWPAGAIAAVTLQVRHRSAVELVFLSLQFRDGTQPILLTHAPSKSYGIELAAAARRIAEILNVPVLRSGQAVQAGGAVRQAVDVIPVVQADPATAGERDLSIDCEKCRGENVPAVAYDSGLRGTPFCRTWVKCLACDTHFYSKLSANELAGISRGQLSEVLSIRVPLVCRTLAVLAIVVCILPYIGLMTAVPAVLVNWPNRGWTKKLSLTALVISAAMTTYALTFPGKDPAKTPFEGGRPHRSAGHVRPAPSP